MNTAEIRRAMIREVRRATQSELELIGARSGQSYRVAKNPRKARREMIEELREMPDAKIRELAS